MQLEHEADGAGAEAVHIPQGGKVLPVDKDLAAGGCIEHMHSVLLPLPLGPMTDTNSPASMDMVTPSSARISSPSP